jgi:hypothetical protein
MNPTIEQPTDETLEVSFQLPEAGNPAPSLTSLMAQIRQTKPEPEHTPPAAGSGSLLSMIKQSSALVTAGAAKKNKPANSKGPQKQLGYPIQTPHRQKFHRVHPSAEYSQKNIPVLLDPDDSNAYWFVPQGVMDSLSGLIQESVRLINLYGATDHTGARYLFVVKQSDSTWYRGAIDSVKEARKTWVQRSSCRGANTYTLSYPETEIPEPDWASFPTWGKMLESAFEGKVVTGPTSKIVVKLSGGVVQDEDND